MAWIYFQELEEPQSPSENTLDPSPTVKSTESAKQPCLQGWPEATSPKPQSGMMFVRSEQETYPTQWMSLPEGHPAKTLVLQAVDWAWLETEAAFFGKSLGCVANLEINKKEPLLSTWKTSQQSLFGGAVKWSEPLPRWGMTVDGALHQLPPWEPLTREKGFGSLPTLRASDYKGCGPVGSASYLHMIEKGYLCATLKDETGGELNPEWCEWFMGYPKGHTEYEAWAMGGCQRAH